MSESLATKYRPKEFSEVSSQESIIKILSRQVETKSYKNAYLFSGPSGCGKTTLARVFAKKINKGLGEPIEIDAASNNGVEGIRHIVDGADQRALDAEYKIYIIDECHSLTSQAWQALLKTIEETPAYTIFMFCTTEYHKVPITIQNRCQQYFLTKIDGKSITNRLKYICKKENIAYSDDAIDHIMKMSQGSMRQAISNLEKCIDFSIDINLQNVLSVLGEFSYGKMFKLLNSIIDKKQKDIYQILDDLYNKGNDLKLFLDAFIDFTIDVDKYLLFSSFDVIKIPEFFKSELDYAINVENAEKYYNYVLDKLIGIRASLKGDSNIKLSLDVQLSQV